MKPRPPFRLVFPLRDRPCAGSCVYCGIRCYGRACPEHRPLIQIDPNYGGVQ